jgi:hypothetical protein
MSKTKTKITKTEAIRRHLRRQKTEEAKMPSVVVAALAEKGIKVRPGLVSQVKNLMKRPEVRRMMKTEAGKEYEYEFTAHHLQAAKKFKDELGGDIETAKAALDVLALLEE